MAEPTDPDQSLLDDFFGPMTPDWVSDASTDGVRTVVLPATKLYNDPLYGKLRGVTVDQGSPVWLKVVMYAPQTGAPQRFSVGSYSTPPTVEVRYREAVGISGNLYVPDDGDEPSLASDGTYVLLPLPQEVKDTPGVYRFQTRVLTGEGSEAARDEGWVYVQRGMWTSTGDTPADYGPPTMSEMRTALRDHPGANRLLGEYEFDGAEVGQALVSAVQQYNNTYPVGGRNFDTTNFPVLWRRQWIDGALAFLFETAGHYQRRGHLPYAAGGVSIDDVAKEKDYVMAANLYRDRFQKFCDLEKGRQSVEAGWGSTGSGVPRYGRW